MKKVYLTLIAVTVVSLSLFPVAAWATNKLVNRTTSLKTILDVVKPPFASTTFPYSTGLTLWWSFNGPDVNWNTRKVTDISGDNNTGTIAPQLPTSTTPVAGAIGQGFMFNAANVVNVTSTLGLTNNQPVFWGGWFFIPTLLTTGQNGAIAKYNGTTQGIELELDNAQRIRCGIDSGSGQLFGTFVTPTGQWFHALCKWANGNLSLWINGKLDSRVAAATFTNPSSAFQVGSVPNTGSFPGKIDEVVVGNTDISTSSIYLLYNLGRNTSRK